MENRSMKDGDYMGSRRDESRYKATLWWFSMRYLSKLWDNIGINQQNRDFTSKEDIETWDISDWRASLWWFSQEKWWYSIYFRDITKNMLGKWRGQQKRKIWPCKTGFLSRILKHPFLCFGYTRCREDHEKPYDLGWWPTFGRTHKRCPYVPCGWYIYEHIFIQIHTSRGLMMMMMTTAAKGGDGDGDVMVRSIFISD